MWNYEVKYRVPGQPASFYIEKSNKILGEEKEEKDKTEGVRTAYIQHIQNIQNEIMKVRWKRRARVKEALAKVINHFFGFDNYDNGGNYNMYI